MPGRAIVFELIADSRRFQRGFADAQRSTDRFHSNSKRIGSSIAAAFTFTAVVAGVSRVVKAAEESQRVARQTEAVIKSTGGAANLTAKQFGDLASAISKKTAVDDEVIQSGENVLATFTNVRNEVGKGNDIFSQATAVAVDMAAALNNGQVTADNLKTANIQLGKALNDPIKGIGALTRVGVTFSEQKKEEIKTLVQSGKTLEAQKIIIGELNREFGGSAAASATAGKQLTVALGNLEESIGAALLPALADGAEALTDLINKFNEFDEETNGMASRAAIIGVAITGLGVVVFKVAKTVLDARNAWIAYRTAKLASTVNIAPAVIAAEAAQGGAAAAAGVSASRAATGFGALLSKLGPLSIALFGLVTVYRVATDEGKKLEETTRTQEEAVRRYGVLAGVAAHGSRNLHLATEDAERSAVGHTAAMNDARRAMYESTRVTQAHTSTLETNTDAIAWNAENLERWKQEHQAAAEQVASAIPLFEGFQLVDHNKISRAQEDLRSAQRELRNTREEAGRLTGGGGGNSSVAAKAQRFLNVVETLSFKGGFGSKLQQREAAALRKAGLFDPDIYNFFQRKGIEIGDDPSKSQLVRGLKELISESRGGKGTLRDTAEGLDQVRESTRRVQDAQKALAEAQGPTAASIIRSLKEEVGGFRTWAKDVQTLMKRGMDPIFIAELSKKGPAFIHALAISSDKEMKLFQKLMRERMEQIQTITLLQAYALGTATPLQIAQGIKSKNPAVRKAAIETANLIKSSLPKEVQVLLQLAKDRDNARILKEFKKSLTETIGGVAFLTDPRTGRREPIRSAAGNLFEKHSAQIAPGGAMRLWAEPETGGEAYIPLAQSKRSRSTAILREVADRFGMGLHSYASGAVNATGRNVEAAGKTAPASGALQRWIKQFLITVNTSGLSTLGGGSGRGWQWQMRVLRAAFPGLALISGFRPGAITSTGNRSYHALGRAVDIPPRWDVFNWISANYGKNTKELIFTPAGARQIHNGKHHVFHGGTIQRDHYNHIHWAMRNGGLLMDRGGWLRPGWNPPIYNGTGKPERVGGAGATYNITINATAANPAEVGREVVEAIRAYEKGAGKGWRN